MHSAVLLKAEVKALQAANEQKKRRERKRKRRIMQGGSLSIQEGEDILHSAKVDAQVYIEVASESSQQVGSKGQQRRCGQSIQAIKQGHIQNVKSAAVTYNVPRTTLRQRIQGMASQRDSIPNSCKLTPYEESAIVQYILDLDLRGFLPRLQAVQEMADLLLSERGESPVGINWTTNFIKRRTEIKAKFSQKYDYKRAKCEDPKII
ncbi:hypothetical protein V500_00078 [Pseudogymnoascus sp. VKM F-4518 (FW-2643)]|nr:hypothetical protein V500_00078 [Pseudogymnoascus sp. VKM F-4518 (FW-2643)]